MPLTCNDTLSSVPLGLTNVREYPGVNPKAVIAHILAANACTTAHGISSLDHIARSSNPKRKTTALEEARELYSLVKALAARLK